MTETVLTVSAATTALVEFIKAALLRYAFFATLEEQTQSIVLQVIAAVLAVVSAMAMNANIFPEAASPTVGFILTGLVASLGSAGIHVVLAWLGKQAGVTGTTDIIAQQAGGQTVRKRTYTPWL